MAVFNVFPKIMPFFLNNVETFFVQSDRPQMTIWRMRIACWITIALHTHSECVTLRLSHCNSRYANAPNCYVYTYSTCIVITEMWLFLLRGTKWWIFTCILSSVLKELTMFRFINLLPSLSRPLIFFSNYSSLLWWRSRSSLPLWTDAQVMLACMYVGRSSTHNSM